MVEEQKEKDLMNSLSKIQSGIYDLYTINEAINNVRSMITALNSDVENNVYSANNVYSQINDVMSKPDMQDPTLTRDPFYRVVQDYGLYTSYLLESSIYKSWMIKFYEVLVEKLVSLLENFRKEWSNLKKVELEKERLERELAELKSEQTNKQKDEVIDKLIEFVKESRQSVQPIMNEKVNEMIKQQEQTITSLKKELEELKKSKIEKPPEVINYKDLSREDQNVLTPNLNNPIPQETPDEEPEENEDVEDEEDNVFVSDEETEKRLLNEMNTLVGSEPVKNLSAYKIELESPAEIREVVGDDFNVSNVGDALISLNEKFNDYLYSKKALAKFLGVKPYKLTSLLKEFKCKNIEVV